MSFMNQAPALEPKSSPIRMRKHASGSGASSIRKALNWMIFDMVSLWACDVMEMSPRKDRTMRRIRSPLE